jgi:type IV pilus assembly protein PilC
MPSFSYLIKDSRGNKHEGTISATNLDAALNKLRESGQTVISIIDAGKAEKGKRKTLLDEVGLYLYKLRTSVPLGTLVFFTRQLSTMVSAGLTIEKSLNNLLYEESQKKFKKVVAQLLNDVKKGFSLSDALERHPGVFSPLYIALVRSGEVSGSLYGVLGEMADYLEFIQDTRRKIISAIMYPTLVAVILTLVTIILVGYVVPQFESVYNRFGAALPIPTQILIKVSNIVGGNILTALLAAIAAVILIRVGTLTDTGRKISDRIKLIMPLFKHIVLNSLMSKFCRTLGML